MERNKVMQSRVLSRIASQCGQAATDSVLVIAQVSLAVLVGYQSFGHTIAAVLSQSTAQMHSWSTNDVVGMFSTLTLQYPTAMFTFALALMWRAINCVQSEDLGAFFRGATYFFFGSTVLLAAVIGSLHVPG